MTFTRNLARKFVLVAAAFAVVLALGATSARADSVTYDITVPNTALSTQTGPYAQVTVTLTSATTATVTFNSCGPTGDAACLSGGTLFTMGGVNAAGVNVNASSWTIGSFSASNFEGSGFTPGPVTDGGSGNVSSFGVFNQTNNSFDGFGHSSTTISFVLTNTGGTWASAADVLAANADGFVAEIHGFSCTDTAQSDCTEAIVTGFAVNGEPTNPVPEPGTLTLLGTGLLTMAGFLRRKLVK